MQRYLHLGREAIEARSRSVRSTPTRAAQLRCAVFKNMEDVAETRHNWAGASKPDSNNLFLRGP